MTVSPTARIIYRDLKTENLLVDKDGYIKMADFGFAKRLASFGPEHRTYTLCGTPEHIAPEIITKSGHSWGVDWWACGINTYEFLFGDSPFEGDDGDALKTYHKIMLADLQFPAFDEERFRDRPSFEAAKDFITKLLTRDQEARLGCIKVDGKSTEDSVRAHPFFTGLDWEALNNKAIAPVYVPKIAGLEDVHNFVSLDEDGSGEGVLASSIEHAANVQTPKAAKALAPRRQKSTSGCCGGNQLKKQPTMAAPEPAPPPAPPEPVAALAALDGFPEVADQTVFAAW